MKTRSTQSGMSIFGMIAILMMLGFFAMCIIRMTPIYFEYLSVRDIVLNVVTDQEFQGRSASDIRRKFDYTFNTNQIKGLSFQDVKIYRKKGKRYIDASYEVRLPILWRIDAVMKFDDLLFLMGDPRPLSTPP